MSPRREGRHLAGRSGHRSVPVVGARAVERMDVPGAGPVPVPFGEEARPRSHSAVTGGVAPVPVGKMAATVSVMPVAVRVMPVAVAVDPAGVAVMPVGARMDPVRMQVEGMGMPVVSVEVPPMVVRLRGRRGVGMGHREERDERAEREPRDRIAAPVPVVMPPPRLGGAGEGEHGRENECGTSHRASSRAGNRRPPRSGGAARTPIAPSSPEL